MLLQNIKSTLHNLRNMSKVQYNITKFITRITKMESFFTKVKIIKIINKNNKTFKHYKSQNDLHDNERHSL